MSHQTYSLIFPIALKSRLRRKQKDRISRNLNLRVKNFSKVITILLLTHGFHVENFLETLFAGRTDFEQITYNQLLLSSKLTQLLIQNVSVVVQDPNYVIWQCPNLNNNRNVLINKLCEMGYFSPHTMDFFLSKPYITPLLTIHKFLKRLACVTDLCRVLSCVSQI